MRLQRTVAAAGISVAPPDRNDAESPDSHTAGSSRLASAPTQVLPADAHERTTRPRRGGPASAIVDGPCPGAPGGEIRGVNPASTPVRTRRPAARCGCGSTGRSPGADLWEVRRAPVSHADWRVPSRRSIASKPEAHLPGLPQEHHADEADAAPIGSSCFSLAILDGGTVCFIEPCAGPLSRGGEPRSDASASGPSFGDGGRRTILREMLGDGRVTVRRAGSRLRREGEARFRTPRRGRGASVLVGKRRSGRLRRFRGRRDSRGFRSFRIRCRAVARHCRCCSGRDWGATFCRCRRAASGCRAPCSCSPSHPGPDAQPGGTAPSGAGGVGRATGSGPLSRGRRKPQLDAARFRS